MFKPSTAKSPTGADLQLYSCLPATTPKAAIQINHGMSEHAARYEKFAISLNEAGYATFAHDHRGHGLTSAEGAGKGQFAKAVGWARVLGDVDAVVGHIQSTLPDVPVVSFGHSMGATIATAFAQHFPGKIDGLAAWNGGEAGAAAGLLRAILRVEAFFKGSDVPSQIAGKATFEAFNRKFKPNRTEFDWLSRDRDEVDKYVSDPDCGFPATISLWRDFLAGLNQAASSSSISALPKSLPVHLLGGQKDPCSGGGKAQKALAAKLKQARFEDVTLELLPDTRHESLNETNRDQTTANFIKWLDARFA